MILWPRFRSGPHGGSLQCSLDRAVEFGRLESEARKGRERGEEGGEKRGKKTCGDPWPTMLPTFEPLLRHCFHAEKEDVTST